MNKTILTTAFTLTTDTLLAGFFLLILVSTFAFAIQLQPVTMANKQILGASSDPSLNFYLNTTDNPQFQVENSAEEQVQIQVTYMPAGTSMLSLAQIDNAQSYEQHFLVILNATGQTLDLVDFTLSFAGVTYPVSSGEAVRFIAPPGLGEVVLELKSDKQINFPLDVTLQLQRN